MKGRRILWGLPALLWLVFTFWYTDFSGPLTEEEITAGLASMKAGGFPPDRLDRLEVFLRADTGRQFLMVNNIAMNPEPPVMPGFGPDATASEYVDYYMAHMYPELFLRACHPVFYATGLDYVADVTGVDGPAASNWDAAALFRYRSRRTFLDIITHPDMRERHDYKLAAMSMTIAYPVEPVLYLSDLRILLFLLFGFVTAVADMLLFRRP